MLVPQTSPQWRRQAMGNERTKDALSVIAARNCATGTARAASTGTAEYKTAAATTMGRSSTVADAAAAAAAGQKRRQFLRTAKTMTWQRICLAAQLLVLLLAVNFGTSKYSPGHNRMDTYLCEYIYAIHTYLI